MMMMEIVLAIFIHLSVDGHAEISDKSSGSTSGSASWCRQVQRTLKRIIMTIMKIILMMSSASP